MRKMSLRKMKNLQSVRYVFQTFCFRRDLYFRQKRRNSVKLYEMGKFQEPQKETEAYSAGQMFFHKVFPYRGVILHPWLARIHDRGVAGSNSSEKSETDSQGKSKKRSQLYYQVLVDEVDLQHVNIWRLSVAFLPPDYLHRNSLIAQPYDIPGIDYVSHEDIMPYTVTENAKPIQHELFEKFLAKEPQPDKTLKYVPKDQLKTFQETNHAWLYLSDVYKEITENVRVTVIPFYMGIQESYNKFWWRYSIRIENLGEESVKLRGRHFNVFSKSTSMEHITGSGVVGKEPKLTKSSPAFQCNSNVSLESPAGYMWGTFDMEREDGTTFKCKIPAFTLNKVDDRIVHNPNDDIIG